MLACAVAVSLLVGVLEIGQPIEDYYRMARNAVRQHPPSGDIVVVGIDDHSLEQVGSWPWPRTRHAELATRLKEAGARRIFFDVFFNAPSTPASDRAFAKAIGRAGNVSLAAMYSRDRSTSALRAKLPLMEFQRVSKTVSVAISYTGMLSIREMPYRTRYGAITIPSMAAALAEVDGPVGESFPLDYAVDTRRIPTISAGDVLTGRLKPGAIAGKDVVVAATTVEMGDLYYVPGVGQVNGGYLNVVGAETLKEGRPVAIGWFLPLVVAFLLALAYLAIARRWVGRLAIALALASVTVLPLVTEARLVFFDVIPAVLLIGIVTISRAWANFRQSYKVRGNINPVSGLPNLNALRSEGPADDAVLVAARVRNYAEITSALPSESERALVGQIVARLALGARGARIYQGDEGIFAWVSQAEIAGPDQLDALHALFRSPALIDGRAVDLAVTFGIDGGGERDLANRIGAALVAADDAATEGLRWKVYDPAKLADAEWKLSLLGRLDAAIGSGEIWVAYQPQLELATGRITGAEALVRWSHPEKGEISPQEFVLAAEQHDRIDKLTEFVLSDAINAAAAFEARGIAFDVAVNISARLLERPGLVDVVRWLLLDSRLEPGRLTLEVTESAAMTSGRTSIRTLEELGSLGINVSIDDYGTGFSTLEYFKRIPATEVKIDRSFVASIDRNASDRVMVRSTIELAHSMGRTVVAEGVERPEILAELTKLGCDRAQGYLIGRPMKLIGLTKLLLERAKSDAA
ncbi:EAL domain-containing protein [Sphingomonas sp.]|uniref:EAL domain-containing protein n=1 Tax=Sphingomonas sp. TaxID=28214 RepID=UPI002B6C1179|nr:EAL domain-containing protein [Sphingomonas sp.]HWK35540.1 EAL domain-containing protein [Sphingomonas sp.]